MSMDATTPGAATPPAVGAPQSSDVDFMSMLSHQLSAPLSTIRWYAELLSMGKMTKPLDAAQADMVHEITLGAARMNGLITGIHDISRLEQDKFTDEPALISLGEFIATIQNQYEPEITRKKLTVTVATSQPAPSITARPSIMSIIVQNLMSNAVKYTPEGGSIQITVRQASAAEIAQSKAQDPDSVFLSVTDTGYGIPKDQQDKVFSKFFRADNVSSLGIDGNGLGLAGAATAVSKLGGGIWFESEEGRGTTMSVVLPVKTPPASTQP